jgi:alcohol dehydrogenase (NADP+)
MIQTYSTPFPKGKGDNMAGAEGHHTNGGFSTSISVNEHFVYHIPDSMDMEYAGVLLCAGITTFSPLNRHILQKGGGKGKKVAIVGFGGLGQMAIKVAKAMGVDGVTILSRGNRKQQQAEKLGCEYIDSSNLNNIQAVTRSFDVIMDTVSAPHDINSLTSMLKVGGTYVVLGAVSKPFELSAISLIFNHYAVEGSLIGGTVETQQMLDFFAKHNIVPEYRVIDAKEANQQFKALINGEAPADRCVIDISTLKNLKVVGNSSQVPSQ